jgi:phosphoglycerol transferase MdoB-like AlkP superfamily enzyme
VKAYIACQLELEKALAYTLEYLEENDMADDTVIVLAPDHFPYGLTNGGYLGNLPLLDELYGYKVNTQMDRDKNTAIIWCGVLEDMDPIIIDKPTSPLDILPTLLNLFGCEWDSRLYIGRDVLSDAEGLYFDSGYNWKTEVGYYRAGTGTFYPNPGYEEVGDAYIRRLNAIVANKISFNRSVINNSYFPYVYSILAEQHAQQTADSSQGEGE